MTRLQFAVLFSLGATALSSHAADNAMAAAILEGRSGSEARGSVTLIPAGEKILVSARVTGLTPGEHGFHIHEVGDCSAPDATSAKGHFNPGGKVHGHHAGGEHHAGDLPNLVADADGNASYSAELTGLQLGEGSTGILGRSVVIHADPDDYKSQPAGNSGKRIACGVIKSH